jgi:hypothetical protein
MHLLQKLFMVFLIAGPAITVPAQAATIIGGTTTVTLNAAPDLVALGFDIQPSGTATIAAGPPPVASFAITGGTVTGGNAIINHDGSGLIFTKGLTILTVSNFRIDTAAGKVTSDVVLGDFVSSAFGLFDIGSGLTLRLTPDAANVFASAFDAPGLDRVVFGTAVTNPIIANYAVPEPSVWAMLFVGFAFAGMALRRRSNDPEMRLQRRNLRIVAARGI